MALVANRAIKASAVSAAINTPFRLPIRLVSSPTKVTAVLATAIPK